MRLNERCREPKRKDPARMLKHRNLIQSFVVRTKIIRHGFGYFGNAERLKQQNQRELDDTQQLKSLPQNLKRHLPDILYTRVSVSVGPRPSRGPYGLPIQAPPVYPLKKSRLTHMAPHMERMRMTCIFQRVAPWKHTLKARVARHYMLSQDKQPITSIFPAPSSSSVSCTLTIAAIDKANIEPTSQARARRKALLRLSMSCLLQ